MTHVHAGTDKFSRHLLAIVIEMPQFGLPGGQQGHLSQLLDMLSHLVIDRAQLILIHFWTLAIEKIE